MQVKQRGQPVWLKYENGRAIIKLIGMSILIIVINLQLDCHGRKT